MYEYTHHHFASTSVETSFLHRSFISGITSNFVALIEANFTKVMHYGIYIWANAAKLLSYSKYRDGGNQTH